MVNFKNIKLTYTQIIALGFILTIAVGAFLLNLPVSSAGGVQTPLIDCIFTAASAACVTGLVVYDTATYWSGFGQAVILVLIQVGGLGLMTVITLFSIFMKKRFTLHERRLLMQSAGNMRMSGVITLVKRIWILTLLFEGLGAILLTLEFVKYMSISQSLWYGVFHSVSAFCNAGFDLMGKFNTQSFTAYTGNLPINFTLMFLIISGGLGFLVWNDLFKVKFNFKRLELHSKIVLSATFILIFSGALLLYLTERNTSLSEFSASKSVLAALFQSVTTRTAGFNTIRQDELSNSGSLLSMLLMIIGGSPGSTAGGLKTTTIAVVVINMICTARNDASVEIFKRRIDDQIIKQASAVLIIYLGLVFTATAVMTYFEPYGLKDTMFEVVSAIGTVGLSTGITPTFSFSSKIIITVLMFTGRIGGMSLVLAISEQREQPLVVRPAEKILIG